MLALLGLGPAGVESRLRDACPKPAGEPGTRTGHCRLEDAGLRSGPTDPSPPVAGMPAGAPTYLTAPPCAIAARLLRS